MKKPNITKGEWVYYDCSGFMQIETNHGAGEILDAYCFPEAQTNAELICKAGNLVNSGFNIEAMPELVNMVKTMHEIHTVMSQLGHQRREKAILESMRKLLKKAKFEDHENRNI